MIDFRPFVYFRKEVDSQKKLIQYHIQVLIYIPNGYKATLLTPQKPEPSICRTLEIKVEKDDNAVNIGPVFFYHKVKKADMQTNCNPTTNPPEECEPGFVVVVTSKTPLVVNGVKLTNQPENLNDYDDADEFPIG